MEIERIIDFYVDKKIGIIGEKEMQRFSVVIPIIKEADGLKILFEVRAKSLRHQPGEISFPGGKIENNETSEAAGIRETCEELGLGVEDIKFLGTESILVTQHNRIIYPYVAEIINPNKILPSKDEVDHVFKVPLEYLLNTKPLVKTVKVITVPTEDFPYEVIASGTQYKWLEGKNDIYFYKYIDYTIWGLTARILYEFIISIKESEKSI